MHKINGKNKEKEVNMFQRTDQDKRYRRSKQMAKMKVGEMHEMTFNR